MEIEKNGRIYEVEETQTKWIIKALDGKVKLSYELQKKDFETLEEVEAYFANIDL